MRSVLMLLAVLEKGLCGGGCGDLGRLYPLLERYLGPGAPFLAECTFGEVSAFCFTGSAARRCPRDYLAVRLFTGEDYDAGKLTDEALARYMERLAGLADELREVAYAVFLTRRPYLAEFTLGPAMLPSDVLRILHVREDECGRLFRALAEADIAEMERPTA
jgi:hypothetical protein